MTNKVAGVVVPVVSGLKSIRSMRIEYKILGSACVLLVVGMLGFSTYGVLYPAVERKEKVATDPQTDDSTVGRRTDLGKVGAGFFTDDKEDDVVVPPANKGFGEQRNRKCT